MSYTLIIIIFYRIKSVLNKRPIKHNNTLRSRIKLAPIGKLIKLYNTETFKKSTN